MAAEVFFLCFVFFKQFYIFPSGNFGIGDACMAAACLFLVLENRKNKDGFVHAKQDLWGFAFLFCIVIINIVYFVIYRQTSFLRYTLFWIYNASAVICFRELINKRFLSKMSIVLKVAILLQCLLYIIGMGRKFHEHWGGIRYMGTFNDPNQLAFYIFAAMILLYIYACQYKDRSFPVFFILSVWIIAVSKSTGIFAGVFLFIIGIGVLQLRKCYRSGRFSQKTWCVVGGIIATVIIIGIYMIWPSKDFSIQESDFSILSRIQEKILKLTEGGIISFLYDRGAEKLILYPQYMLWGAGEGYYERFTLAAYANEIHSSLFSVLFCYGIIPTIFMLRWIWFNLKQGNDEEKVGVFALLGESFFLVNYRQPFFWMVIVMLGRLRRDNKEV